MTVSATQRAHLRSVAEQACANAFAPHSGLRVGAALLTTGGRVVGGCNVETANYTLGLCAERTAIVAAVAAEGPAMRIAHVSIVTDWGRTATPCGACRQMLYEFGPDCTLSLHGDEEIETTIRDLLPRPFGPDDLPTRGS